MILAPCFPKGILHGGAVPRTQPIVSSPTPNNATGKRTTPRGLYRNAANQSNSSTDAVARVIPHPGQCNPVKR